MFQKGKKNKLAAKAFFKVYLCSWTCCYAHNGYNSWRNAWQPVIEAANGLEQTNVQSLTLSQVELLDGVRLPTATNLDATLAANNAEGNDEERHINRHPCRGLPIILDCFLSQWICESDHALLVPCVISLVLIGLQKTHLWPRCAFIPDSVVFPSCGQLFERKETCFGAVHWVQYFHIKHTSTA